MKSTNEPIIDMEVVRAAGVDRGRLDHAQPAFRGLRTAGRGPPLERVRQGKSALYCACGDCWCDLGAEPSGWFYRARPGPWAVARRCQPDRKHGGDRARQRAGRLTFGLLLRPFLADQSLQDLVHSRPPIVPIRRDSAIGPAHLRISGRGPVLGTFPPPGVRR